MLILQFESAHKNPATSVERAETIISKYSEEDEIDIVILPEMAFTGYLFDSREEISPFLEKAT